MLALYRNVSLKLFISYLLLVFCFVFFPEVNAQVFRQFSNQKDAPVTTVLGITQDKDGFMWFATTRGLFRYDSQTFKKFIHDPNNPGTVPSDYVTKVLCDSEGKIWVATWSGLSLFDSNNSTFQNFSHDSTDVNSLSSNYVNFITEDSHKRIWIGTRKGLDYMEAKNDTVRLFRHHTDIFSETSYAPRCLIEGKNGDIWVGTSDGLVCIPGNGATPRVFKIQPTPTRQFINKFEAILMDAKENLWLGSVNGLVYFDTAKERFELIEDFKNPKYPIPSVMGIIQDKKGKFWISTESGLAHFNPADKQSEWFLTDPGNPQSLADDVLYSMHMDRQGGLWLGSYYLGISYLNTHSPEIHTLPSYSDIFTSGWMGNTADKKLWIVSGDRSKIIFSDPETNKSTVFGLPLTSPLTYHSFYVDSSGVLWCGGNAVLTSYDLKTRQRTDHPLRIGGGNTPLTGKIYDMFEDQEGRFWITGFFGLVKYDKKSGKITETGQNTRLYTSLEDSKGNLWFGGREGVFLLGKGASSIEKLEVSRVKSGNFMPVRRIVEDLSGRIWFAVEQGLQLYDPVQHKLIQLSDEENTVLDYVLDIQCDKQGYLWINAESKLIRYHPDKKTVQVYDQLDGLPLNTILPPSSSVIDHSGKLHFVTNRHIFSLDPETISTHERPSPVTVTSLKLFNKEVTAGDKTRILNQAINKTDKITFRYDQNIFSLDFAILSYARFEKNQYAYKLEGFEEDWNYVSVPSATYTNLPSGKYTFLVKAANGDGYWNEEPLRLGIEVLPPWWKTWYAYAFYLLLAGAVIYGVIRFLWLRKSVQKENELYQSKLDFFTNISHEIRTHLSLIINPIEKVVQSAEITPADHTYLTYARNNSERLMLLVNELLDFRKIQHGGLQLHVSEQNLGVVLRNVISVFEHTGKEKEIISCINLPEEPVLLWFDAVQMQKVFFNLLSNAYKFTPEGGQITVSVTESASDVSIRFADNGKGIAQEHLTHLFTNFYQVHENDTGPTGYGIGLALAKGIVEMHYGGLTVSSRVATKTESGYTAFTVRLMKGYAHYSDKQLLSPSSALLTEPSAFTTPINAVTVPGLTEKKTLLLIEDNDELRAFTRESFQDQYLVLEAANGSDALAIARERVPDIIICDVMIPAPNGLEVTQKLKSDFITSHIPVILLTARSASQHIIEGLQTGAEDYLVKPFDLSILQLKVHNLIQGRELLKRQYSRSISLDPDDIVPNDLDGEFIQKLKDLVIEKISDREFGVNDMAFQIGVSVSVLYRKVRAITGMTVNDFMKTIRMKRAKQLLESGTLHVNEVAVIVGFEDRKYFSKEYKRVYGKTPNEVRKQSGEDILPDQDDAEA